MELLFTAVLCWIIFTIPVDLYTIAAILVVSAALAIYSINPVISKEVISIRNVELLLPRSSQLAPRPSQIPLMPQLLVRPSQLTVRPSLFL